MALGEIEEESCKGIKKKMGGSRKSRWGTREGECENDTGDSDRVREIPGKKLIVTCESAGELLKRPELLFLGHECLVERDHNNKQCTA